MLIVLFTFVDQWSAISNHLVLLGGLLGVPTTSRLALAMECGIQNSALGITLAVTVLAAAQLAVPSVIYALLMNVTAFSMIGYRRMRALTVPV